MMHFVIERDTLLKPLQLVAGVIERRQTLPILSNVLFVAQENQLTLTGSDLEVELKGNALIEQPKKDGTITAPARKLLDICKSLPSSTLIDLKVEDSKLILKAGRSRFTLSTLPAVDYPLAAEAQGALSVSVGQANLRRLIERTAFAMAQNDVRYYLNGMLLELSVAGLRVVATDGHRLATCLMPLSAPQQDKHQVIIPRKGIQELARLVAAEDAPVCIVLEKNHMRASTPDFTLTSKLIEGKFPDYERVIPKGGDKEIVANRQALREAFTRAAILSNEKFRGVRLNMSADLLKIQANNPENDEAQEDFPLTYAGETLEIGFNVSYLLDVLGAMTCEKVRIVLSDSGSSALLQESEHDRAAYVVMPMRL